MKTLTLYTMSEDGAKVPFLTVTPEMAPNLGPLLAGILADLKRDGVGVWLIEGETDFEP